jgi:hypothetical protein
MRVSRKVVATATIEDDRRSAHSFLSERFAERFSVLIARPITVVQRAMRAHEFTVTEAVNYLTQQALDRDAAGSTAVVLWLQAAGEELLQGTPVCVGGTPL